MALKFSQGKASETINPVVQKVLDAIANVKITIFRDLDVIGKNRQMLDREGFGPEINKVIEATKLFDDAYRSMMLKTPRSLR